MSFALLEIVRLLNGDIVLRDADDSRGPFREPLRGPLQGSLREPLVRIRFSREVRDMLGDDVLRVAEAMIEAATDHIAGGDEPDEPAVVTSPVLH